MSASPPATLLIHNPNVRSQFIQRIFQLFDVNHDGRLEANEVKPLVDGLCKGAGLEPPEEGLLVSVFNSCDVDHSGWLDVPQFDTYYLKILKKLERDAGDVLMGEDGSATLISRGNVTEHASIPKGARSCPNCGRKFTVASMEVHLRSCGSDNGISKPSLSQLQGETRQERTAYAATLALLQTNKRDTKLSAKCRATFQKLDMNGNGSLSSDQFEIVYNCITTKTGKLSLEELLAQFDKNGDGALQFGEFEALIAFLIPK